GAYQQSANWFQILEGHIDTVHVGFLHYGGLKPEDQPPGSFSDYQLRIRTAKFEVIDTEGGAAYAAARPAGPGQTYWRVAQWLFSSFRMAPPRGLGLGQRDPCGVPPGGFYTTSYQMSARRGRPRVRPRPIVTPLPLPPHTHP